MKLLIIPGLHGSGAEHWQTKWEASDPLSFVRVQQNNWEAPDKTLWTQTLDRYVSGQDEPVILIAHSLGCITVAHWARENNCANVAGALLVAPADVERSSSPVFKTFAPVPKQALPFRTIVVASENDHYAEISTLNDWAGAWEAEFVNVGIKGHINSASGLGFWSEGYELLNRLISTIPQANYARSA